MRVKDQYFARYNNGSSQKKTYINNKLKIIKIIILKFQPFGPGKACCCGHVYNTTSHFCCDESNGKCEEGKFHIYEDTEANKRKCWSSQVCRTEMQTNVVELTCSDSIYHGSHCDFTCPNGFDLAGIDQASCDPKTGVWENIWGQVMFFSILKFTNLRQKTV